MELTNSIEVIGMFQKLSNTAIIQKLRFLCPLESVSHTRLLQVKSLNLFLASPPGTKVSGHGQLNNIIVSACAWCTLAGL